MWINSRNFNVTTDKKLRHFSKFKVCTFSRSSNICRIILHKFTEPSMEPLVGEETSLVFGNRYSSAFGDLFSCRRFQIWFRALLVTAVLMLFDASSCYLLLGPLNRKIMFKTGLLWPSKRKRKSSSATYRADNVGVNPFFLNFPTYCKRSQSISGRNSSIDFLKMPVRVAGFASLHVFVDWRQNVPKLVGKLWSLIAGRTTGNPGSLCVTHNTTWVIILTRSFGEKHLKKQSSSAFLHSIQCSGKCHYTEGKMKKSNFPQY